MASSINQPFLVMTPKRKGSSIKSIFVFLSLASVLCSTAIVLLLLVSNGSSYSFFTLKNPNNICEHAVDQSSCLVMVSEVTHTISSKANKIEILQKILHRTTSQIQETTKLIKNVHLRINDKRDQKALENCIELMEMSLESLIDSMVALGNLTSSSHFDVHTWLSSVLTDHDTCMDMLHGQSLAIMKPIIKNLMSRASTALALIVSISPTDGGAKEFLIPPLSPIKSYGDYLQNLRGQFPSWVSPADRKLLEASGNNIKPNVVVSKGGDGDYETINEALDKAPTNSNDRYVIQIKKGIYEENIVLASNKRNIMFLGDGMEDTIITGSWNVADGNNGTFDTPTVASNAQGFIAQDLCIQNTAGPEGAQAVALRVTGDFSVINRCKLDAYQDTLYVHARRQFYRDCYITGSVDFIFGNAAVVLQKCNIVARNPGLNKTNMITAQGKTDPNQNTGISIQNCQITPSEDLADVTEQFKTFLGRPWREYSTTVVMQSYMDGFIDPAGWAPWNGDLYLDTLYYGEYKNKGPGANTSERVTWKGYHIITDPCVAMNFTVANLLGGGEWIEAAGVRFKEGL